MKFFKDRDIVGSSLNEICRHLRYESFEPGETIFEEDAIGHKFYIILQGMVQVSALNRPAMIKDNVVFERGDF